jgi:hypothetical protein
MDLFNVALGIAYHYYIPWHGAHQGSGLEVVGSEVDVHIYVTFQAEDGKITVNAARIFQFQQGVRIFDVRYEEVIAHLHPIYDREEGFELPNVDGLWLIFHKEEILVESIAKKVQKFTFYRIYRPFDNIFLPTCMHFGTLWQLF